MFLLLVLNVGYIVATFSKRYLNLNLYKQIMFVYGMSVLWFFIVNYNYSLQPIFSVQLPFNQLAQQRHITKQSDAMWIRQTKNK